MIPNALGRQSKHQIYDSIGQKTHPNDQKKHRHTIDGLGSGRAIGKNLAQSRCHTSHRPSAAHANFSPALKRLSFRRGFGPAQRLAQRPPHRPTQSSIGNRFYPVARTHRFRWCANRTTETALISREAGLPPDRIPSPAQDHPGSRTTTTRSPLVRRPRGRAP